MQKEININKLNEKLNKLKKFNKLGVPLCNKIFFSILGITFVTMLISTFSFAGLIAYIGMLSLMLIAGIVNGVIQFTDYEKKIEKLTNELDDAREQVLKSTKESGLNVSEKVDFNQAEMKGYSRTKATKGYVRNSKEQNEEIENQLN